MGVDQGKQLHYEVTMWIPINNPNPTTDLNKNYKAKVLDVGGMLDFEDLDLLMKRWQVRGCVIDANPEKRLALDFASRFPGFVYLCFYAEGVKSRNVNIWSNEPTISVDRTAWLDLSLGRFKSNGIILPSDITEEYQNHIKAQVRKPEKDKYGNPTARYVTGERVADHLAHARNYSEIALQFAVAGTKNQNTTSPR